MLPPSGSPTTGREPTWLNPGEGWGVRREGLLGAEDPLLIPLYL